MWIEIGKYLVNTDAVTLIKIEGCDCVQEDCIWHLKLYFVDGQEKHVKTFNNQQEAEKEYEKIKQILSPTDIFFGKIKC